MAGTKYVVKNSTGYRVTLVDVGSFPPGETEINLTKEKIKLLDNNKVLSYTEKSKVKSKNDNKKPQKEANKLEDKSEE